MVEQEKGPPFRVEAAVFASGERGATMLVNKLTYGHSAISLIRSREQLLPFKADPSRPWRNCSGLDATVIPPHTGANIQQGIIDTPQLHGSTGRAAPWGDVLTNLEQRFNGLSAGAWIARFQVQTTDAAVWVETHLTEMGVQNVI